MHAFLTADDRHPAITDPAQSLFPASPVTTVEFPAHPVPITSRQRTDAEAHVDAEYELFERFCARHDVAVPVYGPSCRLRLAEAVWMPFVAAGTDAIRVRLGAFADLVADIADASLAPSTHTTYRSGWRQFVFWCATVGLHPLEVDTTAVVSFCVWVSCATDGHELLCDERGVAMAGSIGAAALSNYLSSLDKIRTAAGLPAMRSDRIVAAVLKGLSRTLGAAPSNRKAAIDFGLLVELVAFITDESDETVRDRAIAALWGDGGLSAATIAALDWDDLRTDGPHEIVHRSPTPAVVSNADAVRAVRAWRNRCGGHGPVAPGGFRTAATTPARPAPPPMSGPSELAQRIEDLPLPDLIAASRFAVTLPEPVAVAEVIKVLSRPGVTKIVRRAVRDAGLDVPAGTACPDRAAYDAAELASVWAARDTRSLATGRDVALLLVGFYTGLRRGNLVGITWRDLTWRDGGIDIFIGATKTNPSGDPRRGPVSWFVPYSPDPSAVPCAAAAIDAWRQAVASLVTVDPVQWMPDAPLFFAINRHDQPRVIDANGRAGWLTSRTVGPARFAAMSGDAVCDFVQRVTAGIGLDEKRYGAHSTRIGVTTTARQHHVADATTMQITGHRQVPQLGDYDRPDPHHGIGDHPIGTLMHTIAAASDDRTAPGPG